MDKEILKLRFDRRCPNGYTQKKRTESNCTLCERAEGCNFARAWHPKVEAYFGQALTSYRNDEVEVTVEPHARDGWSIKYFRQGQPVAEREIHVPDRSSAHEIAKALVIHGVNLSLNDWDTARVV
ncbi:MAG: hypothetical protein HPY81_10250 [Firmicutes bacterium]|nr:hypothetical protein [Bacillota bacterium]